jgi:hypothetical protein
LSRAAPQFSDEERLERARIAAVGAQHRVRGDEGPTRLTQALAEVHVLARLQRGVKAANRIEGRAPHQQVAAREPADGSRSRLVIAQPIVGALHPGALGRRRYCAPAALTAASATRARPAAAQPGAISWSASMKARQVAGRLGRAHVAQTRRHAAAGRDSTRAPGAAGDARRVIARSVVDDDDLVRDPSRRSRGSIAGTARDVRHRPERE